MEAVAILFISFALLLILGAPIFIALGVSTLGTWVYMGMDPGKMVQLAYTSVDNFPIMALPAFMLAGALMGEAGVSRRLVNFAESLAGPMTGALGVATILGCVFFGAISGSGPATTAAVGTLLIPAMVERNYSKSYAAAVTASSGYLGIVIPPSIPMVVYGITANQSITKMFMAGLIPGALLAFSLVIMNYIQCRRKGYKGVTDHWDFKAIRKATIQGFWSITAPLVILGGIYTGIFTPTESAVVAIFYTLFVGVFIHRELNWAKISSALESAVWISGRIMVMFFTAIAFARLLTEFQMPEIIGNQLLALTNSETGLWIIIVLFLLFLGMFMDTAAIIMLTTPVFLPVMLTLGVDPIHFGVIMVIACGIGFQTPPLGDNLFVASGITGISIEEISLKALPFCCSSLLFLFILVFFPELTLWFPRILGY